MRDSPSTESVVSEPEDHGQEDEKERVGAEQRGIDKVAVKPWPANEGLQANRMDMEERVSGGSDLGLRATNLVSGVVGSLTAEDGNEGASDPRDGPREILVVELIVLDANHTGELASLV